MGKFHIKKDGTDSKLSDWDMKRKRAELGDKKAQEEIDEENQMVQEGHYL